MTVKELRDHLAGLPGELDGLPVVAQVTFDGGWSSSAGVVVRVEPQDGEEDAFYSPTAGTGPYLLLRADEGTG